MLLLPGICIYIYIISFSLAIPTIAGFGVSDPGSLLDPPEHHLNGSFYCITELIYRSTLYLWPWFILNRVQIPRNLWCKSPESTEKSRCTDEFVSTLPGLSMCLVALSGACIMKISSSAGVPIMGVPDQGMKISDFEDLAAPGGRENLKKVGGGRRPSTIRNLPAHGGPPWFLTDSKYSQWRAGAGSSLATPGAFFARKNGGARGAPPLRFDWRLTYANRRYSTLPVRALRQKPIRPGQGP